MGWLERLRARLRFPRDSIAPPAAEAEAAGDASSTADAWDPAAEDPVVLPPSDTLDLHAFAPREAASAVREFLDEACRSGRRRIRIVHGKGIGVQRAMVRRILREDPRVRDYGDAGDPGGWGATVATLEPPGDHGDSQEVLIRDMEDEEQK